MRPFVPTISKATGITGLPVPVNSSQSTPASPIRVTAIDPTTDHFVLHLL